MLPSPLSEARYSKESRQEDLALVTIMYTINFSSLDVTTRRHSIGTGKIKKYVGFFFFLMNLSEPYHKRGLL